MHLGKTVEQEYVCNLNMDNTAHELGRIEVEKYIEGIIDSKLEFETYQPKIKQSKQYHCSY